jgi:hypothetical protein
MRQPSKRVKAAVWGIAARAAARLHSGCLPINATDPIDPLQSLTTGMHRQLSHHCRRSITMHWPNPWAIALRGGVTGKLKKLVARATH